MTTYYVDPVNGSNSNNGLGPDASHASNKPFLTIGKLIAASGAMASGDTAYLAPGTYRETVSVGITSPTTETRILGDPANARGFKTSGGVRVEGGSVTWTAYTTNDKTAPANATTLNLNTRDFLTFEDIVIVGGNAAPSCVTAAAISTNITFRRCTFIPGSASGGCASVTGTADTALTWTFDSCIFLGIYNGSSVAFTFPTSATADYNNGIIFKNCVFWGPMAASGVVVGASGALAFKGGGVDIRNSTFLWCAPSVLTSSSNVSVTYPVNLYNSTIVGSSGTASIAATTSGQIVENYNYIFSTVARFNVAVGGNSIFGNTYSFLVEIGQAGLRGARHRPPFSPTLGSPMLGFGNQASSPTVDILNGPRPAGGASALPSVGAYERANTFTRETGTVRTGSNAISITGPGYQDFQVPVDVASTTITAYVRWDATYAGTKPQMQVINGEEAGVTAATATATGSSGAWEQLSLNFTPTSKGIVTIRFLSSDTNGGGKMFVDDFAAA